MSGGHLCLEQCDVQRHPLSLSLDGLWLKENENDKWYSNRNCQSLVKKTKFAIKLSFHDGWNSPCKSTLNWFRTMPSTASPSTRHSSDAPISSRVNVSDSSDLIISSPSKPSSGESEHTRRTKQKTRRDKLVSIKIHWVRINHISQLKITLRRPHNMHDSDYWAYRGENIINWRFLFHFGLHISSTFNEHI